MAVSSVSTITNQATCKEAHQQEPLTRVTHQHTEKSNTHQRQGTCKDSTRMKWERCTTSKVSLTTAPFEWTVIEWDDMTKLGIAKRNTIIQIQLWLWTWLNLLICQILFFINDYVEDTIVLPSFFCFCNTCNGVSYYHCVEEELWFFTDTMLSPGTR